jgi:peptidoglycan glycosyltransferase
VSNFRVSCRHGLFTSCLALMSSLFACNQSIAQKAPDSTRKALPQSLPIIPKELPEWNDDEQNPAIDNRPVTIIPQIQNQVTRFIRNNGNPIATLVITEVKTGRILALVQGKQPEQWGAETHTSLHVGFPSASLFKTVTTAAGFEVGQLDPELTLSMFGGCARVNPRGIWPPLESHRPSDGLSLRRAYGHSCNGFFAKLAVNSIGLGPLINMAHKLGWNSSNLASDFYLPPSPLREPSATSSSIHTIGKFAAGFGSVGISGVHAAWQYQTIANDGLSIPVHIFKDTVNPDLQKDGTKSIEKETAQNLRSVMESTVLAGTATNAFKRGRMKLLRNEVGGKTGTLTGSNPQGLTTLFAGMYPLENPEIAVSAIVLLENLWKFKASNLAAEGFMAYYDYKLQTSSALNVSRKNGSQITTH